MEGVKGILFVKVSLNNATLTKACHKSLSPRDILILLGFTLVRQLEDIKFDDLPDHQRGREIQFCCLIGESCGRRLILGLSWTLGCLAEIRSVESREPEAHVVIRNCGDFVGQNFVMFSP